MGTNVNQPEADRNSAEQPKKGRGRWSRPGFRRAVMGAVIVLLLVAGGAWYYFHGRVTTDDAEIDGQITPIASRVYGTVSKVLVRRNQYVHAGQVLIKIDPRDYQAKVDQAEAALKLAEAQSRSAEVGVPLATGTTQSAVEAARAEIKAAQAQYDRARLAYQAASTAGLAYAEAQVSKNRAKNTRAQADLKRMKPLVAKAEISEQQYDSYLAAAESAASELKASQEKLSEAQRQVGIERAAMLAAQAQIGLAQAHLSEAKANVQQVPMRTADVHSASANVEQAEANLDAAKLQLSYTTIVAPTNGVVTHKDVEVGQILQPGQEVFAIIPLNTVWVRANFKETQLNRVHPGQHAEIHVDMYGKTFPARVQSLSGATGSRMSLLPPENATGNFVKVVQRIPVKIVFDPLPGGRFVLRPGMNVEATIFTR
jgi:membrane fusion protein (multidrug efflux system)